MPISILDASTFNDNSKWTDFTTNGQAVLSPTLHQKTYTHPSVAFNETGSIRDGIAGSVGQVYQIDFIVMRDQTNQTYGLFGLRSDGSFAVTGPMIYIFISGATSP